MENSAALIAFQPMKARSSNKLMESKKKIDIIKRFANAAFAEMRAERFGITQCCGNGDMYALARKKYICDWEDIKNQNAVDQVVVQTTWDPIFYTPYEERRRRNLPANTTVSPYDANVTYNYGVDGTENIIQINVGGAVTRINVNPLININRNNEFTHEQLTPSCSWNVVHNFGFIPNVYTTDLQGNEIEGVVVPVDGSTIQINFSEEVSGYAYLS
jgi:hypothetical protein